MLALALVLAAQTPVRPPLGGPPGIAVEQRLAESFGLEVGDTVRLGAGPEGIGRLFAVRAVYQPRPDPATVLRGEFNARLHLPDLTALLGAADRVDRFGVGVRPGVPLDSVVRALNRVAFGYRAYPSAEIASESSRTFLVVSRFHRAIGLIAIVASAIFLLCIMLLKVEERRLDAAVMRMIGISRATILRAFVLETCLVAVVGSGLGTGLAWVAGLITNAVYQRRFETTLVFSFLTPQVVATGALLSLGLGVIVGALASLRLVHANPLSLWRRAE
jgi:putative ABC transport system permease protein